MGGKGMMSALMLSESLYDFSEAPLSGPLMDGDGGRTRPSAVRALAISHKGDTMGASSAGRCRNYD